MSLKEGEAEFGFDLEDLGYTQYLLEQIPSVQCWSDVEASWLADVGQQGRG